LFPFAVFLIGLLRVICLPWEFNLQLVGVQDIRIFPFAYLGGENVNNQCQGFVGAMGLIKLEWNDLQFDFLFYFFFLWLRVLWLPRFSAEIIWTFRFPKKIFGELFIDAAHSHRPEYI